MDAPLCRICKTKHYGMIHKFYNDVPEVVIHDIKVKLPIATNKVNKATNRDVLTATNRKSKNRRDIDKYNEYQKEYMRKRRSKTVDSK